MRRLRSLLLPWSFLLLLVALYARLGWPLLTSGHPLGIVAGVFLSTVVLSFAVSAVVTTVEVVRSEPDAA